jgi:hypothetical protein
VAADTATWTQHRRQDTHRGNFTQNGSNIFTANKNVSLVPKASLISVATNITNHNSTTIDVAIAANCTESNS